MTNKEYFELSNDFTESILDETFILETDCFKTHTITTKAGDMGVALCGVVDLDEDETAKEFIKANSVFAILNEDIRPRLT